ncbi:phage integrase family protein [Pseudoalteromonas sp. BSi20311]|uniref:tyrosine-type recombinase/integrase n=1 Tax=Pseudoalteromonas sp. BSi20311 TaxID=383911 RepID=UPI0002319C78|nr:site-specific integrase [Pseudoalteromonas sp. BSi20311]GAA63160.1 phage integrase family protein [Pseudoalteromonas sp. BSi20311]
MKQISESEIKRLVKLGDKSFIRVFDCLYLRISSTNRATWNFRFQSRGKRMQMKIGVYGERNSKTLMDVSNAIKTAIDLKNKSLNGDNPKLDLRRKKFYEIETVEDLATLYLLNKKDKIRTVHILERLYFKEVHPFIGHMLLKKIHPFDIYEVIQQVLKSGRKSIANKTLHLCKNIFKLGVKNQIIEMNPAANYSTKEDAGGNSRPRDVVLSLEEIEIMFDVFREYPKKVPESTYIGFTILLVLGLRKMELFSAKWVDVDLKRQYFHLYEDNTKSNKSLAVPIPDRLIPQFKRLKVLAKNSEFLFPARKQSKRGYISDDTVNHTLADLFGKVISKRKPSPNVLGIAGVTDFVVHDLRRTCRTLMAQIGIREEVAEKCLNHSFGNLVKTYNRYEYKEERKEAHEALANLILPLTITK